MDVQDKLLEILEKGRSVEVGFIQSLSGQDRTARGSFESWSAKDVIAHVNHWQDFHSQRIAAWARGDTLDPAPEGESENARAYEHYAGRSWEEVEALAERAHAQMRSTIGALEETRLSGPSEASETTPLWQTILGTMYSHKLMHFSTFYQEHERSGEAGQLWSDWAEAVVSLDDSAEWQGLVGYNAACSLALAGDQEGALESLRKALTLRPGMKSWSRLDTDLNSLHALPAYKRLYAPAYWWEALEAGSQAEALADQCMRTLDMLRNAIERLPEEEWCEGESLYQRPAGLALHIVQSLDGYSASRGGENSGDPLYAVHWGDRDSTRFPARESFLEYQTKVEERFAHFLAQADLESKEELFPWTGSTVLSRVVYAIRHAQHHLADLAMELQRRGFSPPDWQ